MSGFTGYRYVTRSDKRVTSARSVILSYWYQQRVQSKSFNLTYKVSKLCITPTKRSYALLKQGGCGVASSRKWSWQDSHCFSQRSKLKCVFKSLIGRHRLCAVKTTLSPGPVTHSLTLSYNHHLDTSTSTNPVGNQAQRMIMSCERRSRDRDNWWPSTNQPSKMYSSPNALE